MGIAGSRRIAPGPLGDATFDDALPRRQRPILNGSFGPPAPVSVAVAVAQDVPVYLDEIGKCVARETLGLLKRTATPAVFQKIVWGNAHKLLRIPA